MTTIFIIMAVLFVLFLVFKNKIKKFIIDNRKQNAKTEIAEDFVFLPIGLSRSFSIGFTIEEKGNGQAKITITKNTI